MTRKNKFILIDSNIFYSLFTSSKVFSDNIIKLLTKLVEKDKVVLLLPQQIKDEVTRNKLNDWVIEEINRIDNKIRSTESKITNIEKQFGNVSYMTKGPIKTLIGQVKKEGVRLEKIKKNTRKRFLSLNSKSNRNLNKVFKLATLIEETDKIKNDAFYRSKKDNPPCDKSKFGDKLIWETVLSYFIDNNIKKIELVFISDDKTAWQDKDSEKFNSWLADEFKQKTKGEIVYVSDLSEIPSLTKAEQTEIREEEFKNVADSKLKYANTFSTADRAMRVIINNMNLVDASLAERLLEASVDNNEYTGGPYNQVLEASNANIFLQKLLQHCIDKKHDLNPWVLFYNNLGDKLKEKFSEIRKILKHEGVVGIINPGGETFLDTEDIPF